MKEEARRGSERHGENEPWLEDADAAVAAEVMTSSLEPAELPAGGWERLQAALATPVAVDEPEEPAVGRDGRGPAAAAPAADLPYRRSWPGFAWAAAAAVILVVAGLSVWGVQQAAESARLRDDQRILAYWMGNPEMRLAALQPTGEAADMRMGVLCMLPDGRALMLQPTPAGRGSTYVVMGRGPSGTRELARGPENIMQFDITGVDVVELRLEAGGEVTTLARATVD